MSRSSFDPFGQLPPRLRIFGQRSPLRAGLLAVVFTIGSAAALWQWLRSDATPLLPATTDVTYEAQLLPGGIHSSSTANPYAAEISNMYVSVVDAPIEGLSWTYTLDGGEVRELTFDDGEAKDNAPEGGPANSDLIILPAGVQQVRISAELDTAATGPADISYMVHLFTAPDAAAGHAPLLPQAHAATMLGDVKIITRAEWGADESLRYLGNKAVWGDTTEVTPTDPNSATGKRIAYLANNFPDQQKIIRTVTEENGKKLAWPYEYSSRVGRIVVHHTAENLTDAVALDEEDVRRALRGIYYYHTARLKWGDIGYNYLIDPFGNIYEGRAGGPGVVGAHARWNNNGSIGISMMGNFEETQVSEVQLDALRRLVAALAEQHQIPPMATEWYHRECRSYNCQDGDLLSSYSMNTTIIGHRDAGYTLCPGKSLYASLPAMREQVLALIRQKPNSEWALSTTPIKDIPGYRAAVVQLPRQTMLAPLSTWKPTVSITNTGSQAWKAGDVQIALADHQGLAVRTQLVRAADGTVADTLPITEDVLPGKQLNVQLEVNALYPVPGDKGFELRLQRGSDAFFAVRVSVDVRPVTLAYKVEKQPSLPAVAEAGKTVRPRIFIRNDSSVTWLGQGPLAVFITDSNGLKVASMVESQLEPGQVGTFRAEFQLPEGSGPYVTTWQPRIQGLDTMRGTPIPVRVLLGSTTRATAYRVALPAEQQLLAGPSTPVNVSITLRNTTNAPWILAGVQSAVRVPSGVIVPPDSGSWSTDYVPAGGSATWTQKVVSPAEPGNYRITLNFFDDKMPVFSPNRFTAMLRVQKGSAATTQPVATSDELLAAGNSIPDWLVTPPKKPTATKPTSGGTQPTRPATTTPAQPAAAELPPMRVRIGYSTASMLVGYGNEDMTVKGGNGGTVATLRQARISLTAAGAWRIEDTTTGKIYTAEGTALRLAGPRGADSIATIASMQRVPAWDKSGTVNDNRFRGTLELRADEAGIYAINELPLESYMAGIAEESNTTHAEKQKTIAVIARSYAAWYLLGYETKFPGKPYTLEDSPATSQKYLGYSYELRSPRMVAAVQATAGQVVTYQGKLVKTPYFTQSAGKTKSAQEVWGWTHTPYLVSVDDSACGKTTQLGHGVGLSGCGATAMANAGSTYAQILQHYYTGTALGQVAQQVRGS